MCILGYVIPLTMVLGALNMEFVSDVESNNRYINNNVPYLERYRTAVGMHVDQALTVQSIIPLFTIFPASLSYMLAQFGMLQFHMYSYFTISCLSVATLMDPLVTMYYVSPYRRFARRCLGLSRSDSEIAVVRAGSFDKSSSLRKSFVSMRRNSSFRRGSPV
ncbi:hypothetical protein NECAME_02241 [Necator americanus]|uniref:G protein-coupled receptor n=1 Tax=Necator americanus TaxID=51031 RepID=W2TIK3_NECAM|nr:hypothetical protein NECAME_02241 [Necator americanus]ETN80842.1 hypothetical protein NECAME_02241 [Necator americanus]